LKIHLTLIWLDIAIGPFREPNLMYKNRQQSDIAQGDQCLVHPVLCAADPVTAVLRI